MRSRQEAGRDLIYWLSRNLYIRYCPGSDLQWLIFLYLDIQHDYEHSKTIQIFNCSSFDVEFLRFCARPV